MRLDNENPNSNVEDQRGQGGFANQEIMAAVLGSLEPEQGLASQSGSAEEVSVYPRSLFWLLFTLLSNYFLGLT